jgi:hypothetical protein
MKRYSEISCYILACYAMERGIYCTYTALGDWAFYGEWPENV